MTAVREAIEKLLAGHEPFPAVVVDRHWDLVSANGPAMALLAEGVAPFLLKPPVNALRVSLHPQGMAPRIINLSEWRAHLLARLDRQVRVTGDPQLAALYDELRSYASDPTEPDAGSALPGEIVVPLRLRYGSTQIALFSTVATFGTPLDITVADLAIESFFPADRKTAAVFATALAKGTRSGQS
jgi:hypothetical protein